MDLVNFCIALGANEDFYFVINFPTIFIAAQWTPIDLLNFYLRDGVFVD